MTITTGTTQDHDHEHDYSELLECVTGAFEASGAIGSRLFKTDATGLFEAYLDHLPAERQVHTCNACRRFVENFGGLVVITDQGQTMPAMWSPDVPGFYAPAIKAMYQIVRRAKVTGVFLSSDKVWGLPKTGEWRHMAVTPPAALVYREKALTAGQAMAAHKESVRTIFEALGVFKKAHLDQALQLLKGDFLARAEKFVAPVQWLRDLHDLRSGPTGYNLLQRAVAMAPEGYLHPRAAVTGSLLEDIAAGLDFADIKRKFDAKLGPLQYQRPQAAPSAGNVKAAEALVEKLGLEPSLHRRFARLEEVPTIWAPAVKAEPATGGVFGHLKTKASDSDVRKLDLPAQTMTWEKFTRTVLGDAQEIEVFVPASGPFIAITTAVHAEAPPILKWDDETERNPLAWYVYPRGSYAHSWGLTANSWTKVTGIAQFPNQLGARPMPFIAEGVVLILEGAADQGTPGNALFPECLKEELHGIRATVEAYSRSAPLTGKEEASACGYDLRKKGGGVQLLVTVGGTASAYNIDRWD